MPLQARCRVNIHNNDCTRFCKLYIVIFRVFPVVFSVTVGVDQRLLLLVDVLNYVFQCIFNNKLH